jgi:hypothetical protein
MHLPFASRGIFETVFLALYHSLRTVHYRGLILLMLEISGQLWIVFASYFFFFCVRLPH